MKGLKMECNIMDWFELLNYWRITQKRSIAGKININFYQKTERLSSEKLKATVNWL